MSACSGGAHHVSALEPGSAAVTIVAGSPVAPTRSATAGATAKPTKSAKPKPSAKPKSSTRTVAVTPAPTDKSTPSTQPPAPPVPPVVRATSGGSASIAGCPLFPASNPWRQNVSALAVNSHSAAWVSSIGASAHLHPDFGSDPSYGIPYGVVPANQPKVAVRFTAYGDESDPGPYPIPPTARVEAGGDGHVLIASADCHLYELYGAARSGSGWTAQAGAVFNLQSNALRPAGWTSADAAGLPILPGLVRRDEVLAGQIDHALRFTVSRTQRGYLSPATHQAGSTDSAAVPPMGARFRLKASFDLSSYHGEARVILQALKTYGMIVADNGSNWYLSGTTDTAWNDEDLNQLKQVPGSAFEAVETGPIQH